MRIRYYNNAITVFALTLLTLLRYFYCILLLSGTLGYHSIKITTTTKQQQHGNTYGSDYLAPIIKLFNQQNIIHILEQSPKTMRKKQKSFFLHTNKIIQKHQK